MIVSKRAQKFDRKAIDFTQAGDFWGPCQCGINQNQRYEGSNGGLQYFSFHFPFKLKVDPRCGHRKLTAAFIRAFRKGQREKVI